MLAVALGKLDVVKQEKCISVIDLGKVTNPWQKIWLMTGYDFVIHQFFSLLPENKPCYPLALIEA
jgi:hypothetical protein